ncbi:MAG: heavy metal translocating P-type ATPase [Planctomycetaceae bacterium]
MTDGASTTDCDYCGLPVPRAWFGSRAVDEESLQPRYCCYGCQFASRVTQESGEEGAARWTLTRLGLAIFLTMNVMVFTMTLWSFDVYGVDQSTGTSASLAGLLRSLCLLLSAPVLLLLGQPIILSALQALKRGVLSTDILVMAGVIAAFVYSVVSVIRGAGQTYFEVGCMVLVMMTLGRWLEATSRIRATETLDELEQLLPDVVTAERGDDLCEIPIEEVVVSDLLRVQPGERFPTDGQLEKGSASVDEQLVTGESWPVTKHPGDSIIGGTLNLDAQVTLRVTERPSGGTLSRLIAAVQEARQSQGIHQRLADRMASWFLPVVAMIATATFLGHGLNSGWGAGLMAAMSVLLVACPCALGLATPLAAWCSLDHAARKQVLFRSGEAIEKLSVVKAVRFDKTGTLTSDVAHIARVHTDGHTDRTDVITRARSLAATSTHIFAQTILNDTESPVAASDILKSRSLPGLGVEGCWDGERAPTLLGSEKLMLLHGMEIPHVLRSVLDQEETAGNAVTLIGWDVAVRGVFVFNEVLREDADDAIAGCRALSLDIAILTGDHEGRGRQISSLLNVPVHAGLLPDGKLSLIRETHQTVGDVAMIGDGINDAPALAAADVGIAMRSRADVSRDSADICLLSNDLCRIPWAIDHARQTVRIIRQNLGWAIGYNSLGIALAAFGWLHPIIAAALMLVSSVVVIANSLRLQSHENTSQRISGDSATIRNGNTAFPSTSSQGAVS